MKVVLVSQIPPAAHGLTALLRELGHEPVALLCARERADRYGEFAQHVRDAPEGLDVVIPAARDRMAPLVRAYTPDLFSVSGSRGRSRPTCSRSRGWGR